MLMAKKSTFQHLQEYGYLELYPNFSRCHLWQHCSGEREDLPMDLSHRRSHTHREGKPSCGKKAADLGGCFFTDQPVRSYSTQVSFKHLCLAGLGLERTTAHSLEIVLCR